MSDIPLFRLTVGGAVELLGPNASVERHPQSLTESYMQTFFGVRSLAADGVIGKIDSCGIAKSIHS